MTESEPLYSHEKERPKAFDAVLVHVYGYKEYLDGRLRPSIGGRLQVRAAAELFQRGLVRNIVFTGGQIWGDEYPSLSQVMKEDLLRRFNVPEENIHLVDRAKDTSSEVDLFLEKAKEMGWISLLDMGVKTHMGRIKRLINNRKAKIDTIITEEILSRVSPRYEEFNKRFSRSLNNQISRIYESLVRLEMLFDPDASFLRKLAEKQRTKRNKSIPI